MNQKVCSKCKVLKDKSEFHKHKSGKYGLRACCKSCRKKENKHYRNTEKGLITKMMTGMKTGAKYRNMPGPSFTKAELISWLYNHTNFEYLYNCYKYSNYDISKKPSIDRIDDYKSYAFDNMRLVTWKENFERSRKDILDGVNTKGCRAVIQLNIEEVVLGEYYSIAEAARCLNIDSRRINDCCKGKMKITNGFIFRYKHDTSVKDKHNLIS